MKVRKQQCSACPWKKTTVPDADIPGGYCVDKHRALRGTIAEPASLQQMVTPNLRMMACHESDPTDPYPCVGWLVHQLGPGNNLALRLRAMDGRFNDLQTVGPQHECIEDTLPEGAT